MFEVSYEPLYLEHPEWGQVAILPWDAEIFGFPVADYKLGDAKSIATAYPAFRDALTKWASLNRTELISCSVPGDEHRLIALMQHLGFDFVEYTLQIIQSRMQTTDFPIPRAPFRLAEPSDQPEVERIAEHAFRFVRYHLDARFPRELADRRYRIWLRNAFAALGPQSRMYVTGEPAHVTGFFNVEMKEKSAYIAIIGVDRALQQQTVGFDLCAGSLGDLKKIGIRRVTAKISAAHTGLASLAAFFHFRFSQPQAVFHWHAPDAPHLLDLRSIFA